MIWRVIFCWLLAATFAHASLPRHSAFSKFFRISQFQVAGITLPNGASIVNGYDTLGRLTGTALADHWGHVLDGYGYEMDLLGLRTNITRDLGITTNSVVAGYDPIGQLTSWKGLEAGGVARLNEQLGYGYDAAGNFTWRTNNALVQNFSTGLNNEIGYISRGDLITISGALPAPAASVTVNGVAAQTNGDFTFAATNTITSEYGFNVYTIVAENLRGTNSTNVLSLFVPQVVNIDYGANGEMALDANRAFTYDDDGQLINVAAALSWKAAFVYDGLHRKRQEIDYTWQGGGWVATNGINYIYDGNMVVQERTTNNAVSVTYTRGLDLSGTVRGAGGIGGLLARTDTNGTTFYHADGSGNVTALIDGNQHVTARYEYDPYGRLLGMWGTNAPINRLRFSSKEYIPAAQLYYYGYRFYDPSYQRWPNRDPIGELGGINLYGFVRNNPVNIVDPLGLVGLGDSMQGIPADMAWKIQSGQDNSNPAVLAATLAPLALIGAGEAAIAVGASSLWASLGLGAVAAETPQGQEAIAAVESEIPVLEKEAEPAIEKAEDALAKAASKCEKGTEAARAALGKGANANPGTPVTPQMLAGLQNNLQAVQKTLSLAQQGLNAQGNPIPPEQAQLVIQKMQARIATIQQIIQSGVQAPKN